MFNKRLVCVTGLPRAGSTLLTQLLAHHPELDCPGHSSPLCPALMGLRHQFSDNQFLLAQLDVDFDLAYERLLNAFRGFLSGWFAQTEKAIVVDKNRGWLQHLETVQHLVPDFKMIVCVRELGQIYGSIEAQHQKTLLLDFPDHLANLSPVTRAENLFSADGVVGAPLRAIQSVQDRSPELQQHLYYLVFEHLMSEPDAVLEGLWRYLELPPVTIDWQKLSVRPHESDSYYRFKYRHQTYSTLIPPKLHKIPFRIQSKLQEEHGWFYQTFYPGLIHTAPT